MPTTSSQSTAIVPYLGQPIDKVMGVMNQNVAPATKKKYLNDLATYMMWLYDNDDLLEECLHDWILEILYDANPEDKRNNDKK